jgi:hypothetical protein
MAIWCGIAIDSGHKLWHDLRVTASTGLDQLRRLVATRRQVDADIAAVEEALLRDGEYVENIAAALEVSREKVRRFRDGRGIPDTRETRRARNAPARRPAAER